MLLRSLLRFALVMPDFPDTLFGDACGVLYLFWLRILPLAIMVLVSAVAVVACILVALRLAVALTEALL